MKKSFFLFLFIFLLIAESIFAQTPSKKGLQKVTFGVVLPVSGTLTITTPLKPPVLGYNLLPNIVLVTNKTYHNFLYSIGNNSLRIINGYKLKKDLGIYLGLQKSLSTKNAYAGIGVEKFIPIVENVTFFLFSEVGTNIGPTLKSKVFIIGTHLNIQSLIWKRK
jgi:hypothetical protein